MKTKTTKKNKVNIVTLGCAKNLVDSEVLLTQLKGNKIAATHEAENNEANIVVVNTCGFIEKAKQESIDTIAERMTALGGVPNVRLDYVHTKTSIDPFPENIFQDTEVLELVISAC